MHRAVSSYEVVEGGYARSASQGVLQTLNIHC